MANLKLIKRFDTTCDVQAVLEKFHNVAGKKRECSSSYFNDLGYFLNFKTLL